jgi:two-component system, NarL family, nitrate/nitrite response regulator NarL
MARRIVVADDNPVIRKMLCVMFEAEEDYDLCAEASNGQEAIDLAIKHRPDLIILDLSMPVMNGLEAARQLKKIMPGVPIILFSQYSDGKLGSHPFDRVVAKMDADQLMGHVRALVPA